MNMYRRSSQRWLASLAFLALGLVVASPAGAQPAQPAPPPPPPPPEATPSAPPPAQAAPALQPASPQASAPVMQPPPPAGNAAPPQGIAPTWEPIDESKLPILPRRIDYEEGDIVVPGYTLKSKPSRGLFIAGVVTFAVPYSLSALVAGAILSDSSGDDAELYGPMLLPVFGPFITLGIDNARSSRWDFPRQRDSEDDAFAFIMLLNGFTQAAGIAMIASSVLLPDKYLERAQALPGKPELLLGGTSAAVRFSF